MRTLKFTLEIDLGELSKDERKECAKRAECKPNELPGARDIIASDVTEAIEATLQNSEDFWAGSELYAKIVAVRATPV